jgi:hypothetical protein
MIIDGRQMTVTECQSHINAVELRPWRASAICVHNTAAPTLAQWIGYPVNQRIQNLKGYYESLGWNSGPHFFVDPLHIIPFTPMNQKGTHSPSFNGTHIGIECVGDYARDDDDTGLGLAVKNNLIALLGMLYGRLGLDPSKLAMHKDDPRTTHDCPGKDLYDDRQNIIQATREWMGHGGEHPPVIIIDGSQPEVQPVRVGKTLVPDLNLRVESSAGSRSLGMLPMGTVLKIYGEQMNGSTKWLRVQTPAGYFGWVAARFVGA